MAINLNVDIYGAQFKAFVSFAAEQRNESFIACIEGQKPGQKMIGPNGEPRRIVAKEWDGYGQVWRRKGSKTINNEVRKLFLDTVMGVCGVKSIDKLPPSVLDVLKAEDFDGKGHPLTARRITAITNAVKAAASMEEAGLFNPSQYDFDVYKKKLDYVNARLAAMPSTKVENVKDKFKLAGKMMDFMKNELPHLIADNPDKNGHPCVLRKLKGRKATTEELTSLTMVSNYVGRKLGSPFHLAENIIAGHPLGADLSDVKDPKTQIPAYFERVMQAYVTTAIDLFIECEKADKLDDFLKAISRSVICTEAKTGMLIEFRLQAFPLDDLGPVATHNDDQPLDQCIGREMALIVEKNPALQDSDDFDKDFAAQIKKNLVGVVRPISEAYTTARGIQFRPVLDEKGKTVVRAITEEDIDNLGQAVMDASNGL